MFSSKKFACFAVAGALLLAAGHSASAAVIVNNFGDRGDGYTLIQLSYDGTGANTGTWTVPTGVSSIEVLVVGGGGAGANGGAFDAHGGGAGGLYYSSSWGVTPGGSINVELGIGAPTTVASSSSGATGGDSIFGSIIGYGGEGGQRNVRGGNQGGHSVDGGSNITPGFLGGVQGGGGSAGGAGAGEAGRNGAFSPAYGGAGWDDLITGSLGVVDANGDPISGFYGQMIGFAGGGSGSYDGHQLGITHGESYGGGSGSEPESQPGLPGFDLTGGGGGGGRNNNGGGAGGDGVIYLAFQPVQQIPEPSTIALIGIGLLGLAVVAWRRRK